MIITLTARIRHYVLKNGPCTVAQIAGAVGRYISASRAARAAERDYRAGHVAKPKKETTERGRRRIVSDCLRTLYKRGELKRVAPATYKAA